MIQAQVELVPVDNKVYPFLETMSMRGIIDYNSAIIPISRREVAGYIVQIDSSRSKLTGTERKIVDDLEVEFSFDINRTTANSFSLLPNLPGGLLDIFDDQKQKYLTYYTDPNFSMFFDGIASISYRDYNAEGFPETRLTLGEIGPRLRGTLYDAFGYYIQITGGQSFSGNSYARKIAATYDPVLTASLKFIGKGFVDGFVGYMRVEGLHHSLSLTIGRQSLEMGRGYIDKLFVSDNIPPFDYAGMNAHYKFFRYSFFVGNLRGDSLGSPITSKGIVGHYLDLDISKSFRVGIFESLIIGNGPFSFTYVNPVSYLESSNFTAEIKDNNNNLMGFDCEIIPAKNLGVQLSLLLDDLNLPTLSKHDSTHAANKFGYQGGVYYAQPFGINDLTATVEYTRIDPFVYTHKTNISSYTNWGIGIGAALPPNSDEIALKVDYNLTNRISLDFLYKHQRSGEGFLDANGNPTLNQKGVITRNYGGDINRGDLDGNYYNAFLQGLRVNRDIFTISTRIEPIRQYFLDIVYSFQSIDDIYMSKRFSDQFLYVTGSVDF